MKLITQRYMRKPLYVEAIRVTAENFIDIAKWSRGVIRSSDGSKVRWARADPSVHYIDIQVSNPLNDRQKKAMVGDWVLKGSKGFKIYNKTAFERSFVSRDEQFELKSVKIIKGDDSGPSEYQMDLADRCDRTEFDSVLQAAVVHWNALTPEEKLEVVFVNGHAKFLNWTERTVLGDDVNQMVKWRDVVDSSRSITDAVAEKLITVEPVSVNGPDLAEPVGNEGWTTGARTHIPAEPTEIPPAEPLPASNLGEPLTTPENVVSDIWTGDGHVEPHKINEGIKAMVDDRPLAESQEEYEAEQDAAVQERRINRFRGWKTPEACSCSEVSGDNPECTIHSAPVR